MFQLFYDFHVKYYMNTPDGSGNRKPTLGFCKIGFLIIFAMLLFPFIEKYTTIQVVGVLAGCHVLAFGTLVLLNKLVPKWFNKNWKEIAVAVFVPGYTLSFFLGWRKIKTNERVN